MTESTTAAELGPPDRPDARRDRAKSGKFTAFQVALLLGALVAALSVWSTAHLHTTDEKWQVVILVVLSTVSYLMATSLSGSLNISGSLLSITLAAVLLGGPPAAIVGVTTIAIGWLRFRGAGHVLRHNLVMYAWFPLLSGLAFTLMANAAHVGIHDRNYWHHPQYYLLVLATFALAVVLNFAMAAAYTLAFDQVTLAEKLSEGKPLIAAELSSAVLTLIAVFLVKWLGSLADAGLLLFAVVLVIFQYLIGELLLSQHRGEELVIMATTDELTGLPNRKHFNDHVDAQIASLGGTGGLRGAAARPRPLQGHQRHARASVRRRPAGRPGPAVGRADRSTAASSRASAATSSRSCRPSRPRTPRR